MTENMNKSFDYCNKCGKADDAAVIHCAVCSYPYHAKCVAPKLTIKACDDLISNNNFQFYCDDHQNLCVHKLLNRISLLERKFRICLEPLTEINCVLDKHQSDLAEAGYNKSTVVEQGDLVPATITSAVQNRETQNVTLRRPNKKRMNNRTITQNSPNPHSTSSMPLESPINSGVDCQQTQHAISFSQQHHSQNATEFDRQQEPPTLVCVAPKRGIFLSGFEPNTTTEDIQTYIEYYAKDSLNINIRKMKFHDQSRSAVFVIYVGRDENAFNILCDSSFWPQQANCREYDFFRQRLQSNRDHRK